MRVASNLVIFSLIVPLRSLDTFVDELSSGSVVKSMVDNIMDWNESHVLCVCALSTSVESGLTTIYVLQLNIRSDVSAILKVGSCFRVSKVQA